MLSNYLLIAIRNLKRHKAYSILNLMGLTAGLTCCMLILIFAVHENGYDQDWKSADKLYRLYYGESTVLENPLALTNLNISPNLKDEFPQISKASRIFDRAANLSIPEKGPEVQFSEENYLFVDDDFLEMFDVSLLDGSKSSAFDNIESVILSEEMASRFYGNDWQTKEIIGKTLLFDGDIPTTITGVAKEFPVNSHLHFNFLSPYEMMFTAEDSALSAMLKRNWIYTSSYTYIQIDDPSQVLTVEEGFTSFKEKYMPEQFHELANMKLEPVLDIHLRSATVGNMEESGNLENLYLFLGIALITIIIAAINFVNLSIARSLVRAKEVGIRKILGAGKSGLITQHLSEALLFSLLAFVFSLMLVIVLLPFVSDLTNRTLEFSIFGDYTLTSAFLGLALVTGLLAGLYPAFFITAVRPVRSIKGQLDGLGKGNVVLRKGLITIQFAASIALIIGTLMVIGQLRFVNDQDLGFDKEQVITVPLNTVNRNNLFTTGVDGAVRKTMSAFESDLLSHSGIEGATLSSFLPGYGGIYDRVVSDSISAEDNVFIQSISVDYDFFDCYEVRIVAGRDFDESYGTDHLDAFMINESAVAMLGFESAEAAIGRMVGQGSEGKIIGVLKDYHFASLRQEIEPLLVRMLPTNFSQYSIKLAAGADPSVLKEVENVWYSHFPDRPFNYQFLDVQLANNYEDDARFSDLVSYFAGLAIFISALGLLGLVSYSLTRRSKEIGIRKVLGATVTSIIQMVMKEYLLLVLLAAVIAIPTSFYYLQTWLEGFAYHVDMEWHVFAIGILLTAGVACATIILQTSKAAMKNPVSALRDE